MQVGNLFIAIPKTGARNPPLPGRSDAAMGGIEAYERMRGQGGDVPLILMTGYSTETVQSRFVKRNKSTEESGAVVLQKPYSVEGLGRKVREILDDRRRKWFHTLGRVDYETGTSRLRMQPPLKNERHFLPPL
jgi:DNA-binding NtrC family response regulator